MNPEEGAVTSSRRAWGHPLRDLEVREPRPHACLVDAKHGEVLGLNRVHVALVRDRQRTPFEIVEARRVHGAARERSVIVGAWVVARLDVCVAFGRRPEGRKALVARELCRCRLACG